MKSIFLGLFLAIAAVACDTPENSTGNDMSTPPATTNDSMMSSPSTSDTMMSNPSTTDTMMSTPVDSTGSMPSQSMDSTSVR